MKSTISEKLRLNREHILFLKLSCSWSRDFKALEQSLSNRKFGIAASALSQGSTHDH
jgi:hypothetical protein